MAEPPPLPPGAERRQHVRRELFACARLTAVDETLVLYARNISLGGVLLARGDADLSSVAVGSHHDLLLFDAADENVPPVRCAARVVRHDPDAVAFMWASADPATAEQLARLLAALRPRP